ISEILEIGVQGYIVKPFEKIHVLVNVAGALARRGMESDKTWRRNALDKAVRERTRELDRILEEIKKAKAAGDDLKSRVKDQLA
ncbi:MAG: hypothetical protein JW884_14955, partial [Deltaproteobacteria bacterium]|nr:hypothetical protein [Deltaproteobacteria bacterium]